MKYGGKAARKQIRDALLERDGDKCHICGKPLRLAFPSIDHIIPMARGGSDDISNLALSHVKCNNQKASR